MTWRGIVRRVIGLALFAVALLRLNFVVSAKGSSYLSGSAVTPLAVTLQFASKHISKIPWPTGQLLVNKMMLAAAIPGEFAAEQGYIPAHTPKSKFSKKKKKTVTGLENKARAFVEDMSKDRGVSKFVTDNSFAEVGGVVIFFSMVAALFLPYEGLQNLLLGMVLFWVGGNGVHGDKIAFTPLFWGILVGTVVSLYILSEPSPEAAKKSQADANAKTSAAKKKKDDDWDDGIGGVTMDEIRKRGDAGGCSDGCCG